MGNATPEVLAAADRVVAGSDAGGLVEVAELLLGDEGQGGAANRRSHPSSPA
jgi:hypothetical protein